MKLEEKKFFKKCIRDFHDEALEVFGCGSDEEIDLIVEGLLKDTGTFWVMKLGVGMILGHVSPYLFNPSKMVAYEIGWYVVKDKRGSRDGIRLLKEFDAKAKEMGADVIMMATLAGNDIGKFYEKMGYEKQEMFYSKSV